MKKQPKTKLVHVIQYYGQGYGWEDVSEYERHERRTHALPDLREYRASGTGSYRIISRRVPFNS